VRYVQYITPHQILPLFNDERKMQTRVQLIDAKDASGNLLSEREASRLLELALKPQEAVFEFVVMPQLTKEESAKLLENLKYSTTLA